MIENPPDDERFTDELWFVGDGGRATKQRDNCSWLILRSLYKWPYAARLGERWFIVHGCRGDRRVIEFASKKAAQMAWRIMR